MINFSSSVQVCIAWCMKFLCVCHEFPYVVQLLHEFLVSGELKYNRWLISLIYKKCVLNTRFITTTMLKQQFQRFGILLMWKRGRGACANRNTPLHTHTFYWRVCSKTGQWAFMYVIVRGITSVSTICSKTGQWTFMYVVARGYLRLYDFRLAFGISTVCYFYIFILLHEISVLLQYQSQSIFYQHAKLRTPN